VKALVINFFPWANLLRDFFVYVIYFVFLPPQAGEAFALLPKQKGRKPLSPSKALTSGRIPYFL